MTALQIVTLIALVIVSGGVTAALFQLIKQYVPESNNLRRVAAYVLALVVALAQSWLAGDVLGIIGSWTAGTMTAEALFAYATAIWGAAEAGYRLWYKVKASTP